MVASRRMGGGVIAGQDRISLSVVSRFMSIKFECFFPISKRVG